MLALVLSNRIPQTTASEDRSPRPGRLCLAATTVSEDRTACESHPDFMWVTHYVPLSLGTGVRSVPAPLSRLSVCCDRSTHDLSRRQPGGTWFLRSLIIRCAFRMFWPMACKRNLCAQLSGCALVGGIVGGNGVRLCRNYFALPLRSHRIPFVGHSRQALVSVRFYFIGVDPLSAKF